MAKLARTFFCYPHPMTWRRAIFLLAIGLAIGLVVFHDA
jgi:hypothetical protein